MTATDATDVRELYDAARTALAGFPGADAARFAAALPRDPGAPRPVSPVWKPGASHLVEARPSDNFTSLFNLIQSFSRALEWRNSYTEAEIGESYLKSSSYVELIGLRGHFASDRIAFGLMVVGPECFYPDHRHMAEEIYAPIAGRGEWRYDFGGWRTHGAGDVVHSPSNVWHALRTRGHAMLILYAWMGGDLAQKSEIAPNARLR